GTTGPTPASPARTRPGCTCPSTPILRDRRSRRSSPIPTPRSTWSGGSWLCAGPRPRSARARPAACCTPATRSPTSGAGRTSSSSTPGARRRPSTRRRWTAPYRCWSAASASTATRRRWRASATACSRARDPALRVGPS
ncbi:MAG: Trehalose synthase, partial [uncultured Frankineae bacterium]